MYLYFSQPVELILSKQPEVISWVSIRTGEVVVNHLSDRRLYQTQNHTLIEESSNDVFLPSIRFTQRIEPR